MAGDTDSDFDSAGEPLRDAELCQLLRQHSQEPQPDALELARQLNRISVAARARAATLRQRSGEPAWWEWIARIARPLPASIALTLSLIALMILETTPPPLPEVEELTTAEALEAVLVGGARSSLITDALIAPASPDSFLAQMFTGEAP